MGGALERVDEHAVHGREHPIPVGETKQAHGQRVFQVPRAAFLGGEGCGRRRFDAVDVRHVQDDRPIGPGPLPPRPETRGEIRFLRAERALSHAPSQTVHRVDVAEALQDSRPALPPWCHAGARIAGERRVKLAGALKPPAQPVEYAAAATLEEAVRVGLPQRLEHGHRIIRLRRRAQFVDVIAQAEQRDIGVEGSPIGEQPPLPGQFVLWVAGETEVAQHERGKVAPPVTEKEQPVQFQPLSDIEGDPRKAPLDAPMDLAVAEAALYPFQVLALAGGRPPRRLVRPTFRVRRPDSGACPIFRGGERRSGPGGQDIFETLGKLRAGEQPGKVSRGRFGTPGHVPLRDPSASMPQRYRRFRESSASRRARERTLAGDQARQQALCFRRHRDHALAELRLLRRQYVAVLLPHAFDQRDQVVRVVVVGRRLTCVEFGQWRAPCLTRRRAAL